MAHAITETHGNADFSTGIGVPDNGDSGSTWWGVIIAAIQQIADRLQRLRLWQSDTPSIHIPMANIGDPTLTGFVAVTSSDKIYFQQDSVSTVGQIYFAIPQLVTGRKITGVTAYWQNASNTTLPITTKPTVQLKKIIIAAGTAAPDDAVVGSQADTTAVVATYQAVHTIALTGLTETIAEDAQYYIEFNGENGTNATTGGILWGLRVHLGV